MPATAALTSHAAAPHRAALDGYRDDPCKADLGYADVRKHLGTEHMRQTLQADVFHGQGLTEIWINGAWRKATPVFDLSRCQRFGLRHRQDRQARCVGAV